MASLNAVKISKKTKTGEPVHHDSMDSSQHMRRKRGQAESAQEFFYNKPLGEPLCLRAFVAIFMAGKRFIIDASIFKIVGNRHCLFQRRK